MKFCIINNFSKFDQIHRELRIWSHLLKKSLMENFIFCVVVPRKIRETLYILKNTTHINNISYMPPEIWLPNLRISQLNPYILNTYTFFYRQLVSGLTFKVTFCFFQITYVCKKYNNFQDSKSIFMMCHFKIFPIILLRLLNSSVLSV